MSHELQELPPQSAASLLDGILGDLQNLVQQQLALTRQEVVAELKQCASAGIAFGVASALTLVSGIEFAISAAHLLHWWAQPTPSVPETLPLWTCHAAIAGGLAFLGGMLWLAARSHFSCRQACVSPAPELQKETTA
jgi:hypothetical protein